MFATSRSIAGPPRRGSVLPALIVAMLVVGGAIALTLDRLWLDAAMQELQNGTAAAALAAAGRLADDDTLRGDLIASEYTAAVRQAAADIAADNHVCGQPLVLNANPSTDIHIGRIVTDVEGREQFLETDLAARSVVVYGSRSRRHGNPISLFFSGVTNKPTENLCARAEASVDNRVVGLRPNDGLPVPALPLAILMVDSSRVDTWVEQIEQHLGQDLYGFDPETKTILEQPDGIPEIVLRTAPNRGASATLNPSGHVANNAGAKTPPSNNDQLANVRLVDIGNGLDETHLLSQFTKGWTKDDLQHRNGEFRIDQGPVSLNSQATIPEDFVSALNNLVGVQRICLLYSTVPPGSNNDSASATQGAQPGSSSTIHIMGLVAGRIMTVTAGDNTTQIILQPTVITTRTALLQGTSAAWSGDPREEENPYIYKLHITQ